MKNYIEHLSQLQNVNEIRKQERRKEKLVGAIKDVHCYDWKTLVEKGELDTTGKNNRFPFLDIFGYLKNTHKNPKFGKVRQVPTREFPTKFPDWDLSHSSKFGIFVGIL